MKRPAITVTVFFLLAISLATQVCAADAPPANPYSGDIWSRSTLTGDWGGLRNYLAKKGVTFDINMTMTEQGVVRGGKNSGWEYGGRGDVLLDVDTGKLGLWPGGYLRIEAEGNFGNGVNGSTGALMPVNMNQLFPTPGKSDFAIPTFMYTQFFSEYFGVLAGKLYVTGAEYNEFTGGPYYKGDTMFMNVALNHIPSLFFTVPYTPLGAGVVILPNKDPEAAIVKVIVLSSAGKATTSGFDNLNGDAVTSWAEGRVRTDFFGMTGHQVLGGMYSNKKFTSIDQRISLDPEANSLAKKKGSWAVYYNFDQYLYEPVKGSGKGFGVFGKFGASDGNPNFMQYFYSLGVGGKGVMESRPNDLFGVGWYYIDIKNPELTIQGLVNKKFLRDEQGVELYYSFAVTPWAHLTPNIQVIHGAQKQTLALLPANRKDIHTATILGLRLHLNF